MSVRTENPKPGRCVAAVRRGSEWHPYYTQCTNKRRKGREWCGVHDPGEPGRTVYAAAINYRSVVTVAEAQVLREGPKTVSLSRGIGYRKQVGKDEVHATRLAALAALCSELEAKRDSEAARLAHADGRLAAARAAFALEGGAPALRLAQKELDPQ